MPYCTPSDISSEFKNISFAAGSDITEAEVTQFIVETDALINAHLAPRYETPITGAEALSIVKKISIDYVAFRVAKVLNLKKSVPLPGKDIVQELNEGVAYQESKAILESLKTGTMELPDAVKKSLSGLSSYQSTNSIEPVFERGVDQW